MRKRVIILGLFLAVIVAGALVLATRSGDQGLSANGRLESAEQVGHRHVVATEEGLRPGLFPYWSHETTWSVSGPDGWVSGYLPGELWLEYELTGNSWFSTHARSRERPLALRSIEASEQDIGQRYFYSFAQAYEVAGRQDDRRVALKAAKRQAARFVPRVGAFRSREGTTTCPVIIDELMNTQLLFWGADNGGPNTWRDMAHDHALTVARDFVRADGSTYAVVVYDTATGRVVNKTTYQGYSADSTWSRGQAWAIYGFSATYRETHDPRLLAAARKVADWYLSHVPSDYVPYWDFDAPGIPNAPRDSSAAAIAASGLLDLARTDPDPLESMHYWRAARATLDSLASPAYLSTGASPAVLLHGTLNFWSPNTVDAGLSFGDYFFLEALARMSLKPTSRR